MLGAEKKLDVPIQRCLCIGKKYQPFPLIFVWADLWECKALWSITIPFGSWWKEKRFDCSFQIKIHRSLLGQKTTFFFFFSPFLSFFCCYLSLPDWSALQVCGRHRRGCWDKELGEGGRKEKWKRPLDWRHGVWEEEAQWQEQCFGLRKFAADQKKLW